MKPHTKPTRITRELLNCCRQSLAEEKRETAAEGDRATCSYSFGADIHQLIRIGGEWRRVAP